MAIKETMGKQNFFDDFSEATQIKIDLLRNYLYEWLPVFIHSPQFFEEIHIYDTFCGPGKTKNGKLGSPFVIMEAVLNYTSEKTPPIKIFFSDAKKEHIENLTSSKELHKIKNKNEIVISCKDFSTAFEDAQPSLRSKRIATFMFIDQFGVINLTKEIFLQLCNSPCTDWMAFCSSSTLRRFREHENFKDVPKPENFGALKDSHREVTEAYRLALGTKDYYLLPFSIKQGKNINGIIFGSGHVLGADKFIKVCWKEDTFAGQANYHFDNMEASNKQCSLLTPTKLTLYEEELKSLIQYKTIKTNQDIYEHSLQAGILPKKVSKMIKKFVTTGILEKTVLISYDAIYKKKNITPLLLTKKKIQL